MILQQSVGGPYLTRNEARARLNMTAIDGGDELIVPLNVTANGDQNPIPAAPPTETPAPGSPDAGATPKKMNGAAVLR